MTRVLIPTSPIQRKGLLALTFALLAVLTACSASDTSAKSNASAADSLVIIAGAHAGMPAAGIPAELKETVLSAIAAGSPMTVIADDGSPAVTFRATGYPIDNANPEARANSIDRVAAHLIAAVRSVAADSNGNDLGAAIAMAADQLRADRATRGTLIIIDNGLSDSGYPTVTTPGLLNTDTSAQVTAFGKEHGYLPTFPRGTTVELVGFGYTSSPQPTLTPEQRDILSKVWRGCLSEAGAKVDVLSVPRSGPGIKTNFTTQLVAPGTYEQIQVTRTDGAVQAELPSDVLFDVGSADLRRDPGTSTALRELAQLIASTPGTVTITGYTDSTGSVSSNLRLSRDRALSVESYLVSAGNVTTARVRIDGKGESDPAIPNATTPEQLQQNRRVTVTIRPNN